MARVVAEKMSKTLGQQIVVENRPGAIGTIAMRQIAKSAADGYLLGQANTSTLAIAPSMHAADERVPLADLQKLTAVYRTILDKYFG